MRETRVFTVINFADMRFQLFDGAVRPAALILFGRPAVKGASYRFDYLTPKADLNLKSRRLITIASADRHRLDSSMVAADPFVFKKRLWMSEPEARTIQLPVAASPPRRSRGRVWKALTEEGIHAEPLGRRAGASSRPTWNASMSPPTITNTAASSPRRLSCR